MAVNSVVMRENNNDSSPSRSRATCPQLFLLASPISLEDHEQIHIATKKALSYKYDLGMQVNQLCVTSEKKKYSAWLEFKFCNCTLCVT